MNPIRGSQHARESDLVDAVFATTPSLLLLVDAEGRIARANAAAESVLGFRKNELIGWPFQSLMGPEWGQLVDLRLVEAAHETAPPALTPWHTRHGEARMIQWSCRRLPPRGGLPSATLIAGYDLTESLHSDAEDSFHQMWLGYCHDLPFIGMALISIEDGGWLRCNEQLLKMLGFKRDELFRLSWQQVAHPDDLPGVLPLYDRTCEGELNGYSTDIRLLRQNGSVLHTSVHVQAIRRADGTPIRLLAMVHDITERTLAEQQRRSLFQILDQARDGILVCNMEDQVIYSNKGMELLLGTPSREILGRSVFGILPRDPSAHDAAKETVLQMGEWRGDFTLVSRDGNERIVESRWSLARDSRGEAHSIIAICTDITARRRAEEQVRLQTAALEAAANGIIITEANGSIRWVNQAFTRLTGYSPNEVIGETPRILSSGRHPAEFFAELWRTILSGGVWRGEVINRRKDGTLYEQEMVITSVRDARGGISHFISVMTDITERKAGLRRLRDSEALHRSLMDHLPHCVFRKDVEGRFTFVNRAFAQTLGHSAESILGQFDFNLFPPHLARQYRAQDLHVMASGETIVLREEFQGADGCLRNVELTKHPIREGTGQIIGVQAIFWDITERLQAEKQRHLMELQLRHAQKLEAIGQLAAGIAHEINTPTQFIGDNTRFLREAFGDLLKILETHSELEGAARTAGVAPELLEHLRELREETDLEYLTREIPTALQQSLDGVSRVASIVRAMKEFSHPGNDEKTATDLNRAIESTLTVSRNEWKYVADLVTDLDPTLPHVPCLPGEFNQVILNLVVNAAHAIADAIQDNPTAKGTITVATRRDGPWAEIRVTDTGTGIPVHARNRVFDPFFTTKAVGKGTGQGLAIARSVIVDKHRGTIRFETETGRGTTFIIRLPLGEEAARPAPSP